jgi:GGDEF domain-containing protein
LATPYLLHFSKDKQASITVEHHCSASIGVVLFGHREAAQDDVLEWADAAMYQAKDAGRNAIRFCERANH